MKQKLLILLAALMAAVSAHAFQYTHEGQTLSYSKTSSTTCELTNYKANDNNGDIIIPDVVTYNNQEYTVTSIAENCFKNYAGLSSIDVPETITCIGNSAFYGCVGLTNVVIPNSVTTLGESVFYGCTGLTGVTLPNAVDEIKDYTFYGCSNLQSIELPDSITKIGKEAFNSCLTLKSITIPETVTSVGQSAFVNCSGLESIYGKFTTEDHRCLIIYGSLVAFAPFGISNYTIPNTVTIIGYGAFKNCEELTSIIIPESVHWISSEAFRQSGLTSITLPESITGMNDFVFMDCHRLHTAIIPSSLKQ